MAKGEETDEEEGSKPNSECVMVCKSGNTGNGSVMEGGPHSFFLYFSGYSSSTSAAVIEDFEMFRVLNSKLPDPACKRRQSTVCVNTGNMNTADLFLSMVNKITVKFVLSNLGKKELFKLFHFYLGVLK